MAFDQSDIAWLEGKVRYELDRALEPLRQEIDERFSVLRLAIAEPVAQLADDGFLDWETVEQNLQTLLVVAAACQRAESDMGLLISTVESRIHGLATGH